MGTGLDCQCRVIDIYQGIEFLVILPFCHIRNEEKILLFYINYTILQFREESEPIPGTEVQSHYRSKWDFLGQDQRDHPG